MKKVAIILIVIGLLMMGSGYYLMNNNNTTAKKDNKETSNTSNKKILSCVKTVNTDNYFGTITLKTSYDNGKLVDFTSIIKYDIKGFNDVAINRLNELDLCSNIKTQFPNYASSFGECNKSMDDDSLTYKFNMIIDNLSDTDRAIFEDIDTARVRLVDDEYECSIDDGSSTNDSSNNQFSTQINNARKDAFVDTAKEYANAVKTAWAADEIVCGTENTTSGGAGQGTYVVWFQTGSGVVGVYSDAAAVDNQARLIKSGGKSSWGNSDISGYVTILLSDSDKTSFRVNMVDARLHAIVNDTKTSDELERNDVKDITDISEFPVPDYAITCAVS